MADGESRKYNMNFSLNTGESGSSYSKSGSYYSSGRESGVYYSNTGSSYSNSGYYSSSLREDSSPYGYTRKTGESLKGSSYVYGSAVKKAAPEQQKDPERELKEDLKHVKDSERKIEANVSSAKSGLRAFTFYQTVTLSVFCLTVLFFAGTFIMQKCALMTEEKKLESLQKEYDTVTRENTLLEERIENETDYAYIYDYAVNVLSMSIPSSHQIVTYNNTNTGYVVNNAVIPEY